MNLWLSTIYYLIGYHAKVWSWTFVACLWIIVICTHALIKLSLFVLVFILDHWIFSIRNSFRRVVLNLFLLNHLIGGIWSLFLLTHRSKHMLHLNSRPISITWTHLNIIELILCSKDLILDLMRWHWAIAFCRIVLLYTFLNVHIILEHVSLCCTSVSYSSSSSKAQRLFLIIVLNYFIWIISSFGALKNLWKMNLARMITSIVCHSIDVW